jgi:hypothetical protein
MIRTLKASSGAWLALSLCAGPAAQAADTIHPAGVKAQLVEEAFGSTIVSTFPDGREGKLWLQRDGAYTAMGRRHNLSSGTWQIKDDKLCMRQHAPFPVPFLFCTAIPPGGDKPWSGKSPTGEPVTIRLVKGLYGREDPSAGGPRG